MMFTSSISIAAAFIIVLTQNTAFTTKVPPMVGILVILAVLGILTTASQSRSLDGIRDSWLFLIPYGTVVGYSFSMFDGLRGSHCNHTLLPETTPSPSPVPISANATFAPTIFLNVGVEVNDNGTYIAFLIIVTLSGLSVIYAAFGYCLFILRDAARSIEGDSTTIELTSKGLCPHRHLL